MVDPADFQARVNDLVALQLGRLVIEKLSAEAHVEMLQKQIAELEAEGPTSPL